MRDLVDAAFRLLTEWSAMTQQEMDRLNNVYAYFRDKETEFETGEPVLPSWASLGDAAARYGTSDSDPFAAPTELPPTDDPTV